MDKTKELFSPVALIQLLMMNMDYRNDSRSVYVQTSTFNSGKHARLYYSLKTLVNTQTYSDWY